MHTNSSNVDGVKQTEEPRWKLFEAQLKSKLQEAEGSVVKDEIDLCGEVRFIWWQTSSQANFKFVGKKSIIENELMIVLLVNKSLNLGVG